MMRIGLLGCGNIGHIIAQHKGSFEISAVYDQVFARAQEIASISGSTAYEKFDAFLKSDIDIVVEAASISAVKEYAGEVLSSKKDLVIMSVGALADSAFRDSLERMAEKTGNKIFVPSGAIFGLDNLKIGRISKIGKLLLRTTKSPQSLGIEADSRRRIFCGKANECIKAFPKNVNVSVAMSLAARNGYRCRTLGRSGSGPECPRVVYRGRFWGDLHQSDECSESGQPGNQLSRRTLHSFASRRSLQTDNRRNMTMLNR